MRLNVSQQSSDGLGGNQKGADGENNEAITELPQPLERHGRRLAAFGPVEEQRHIRERTRDLRDFILALRSLHEKHVRASFTVSAGSTQRVIQTLRSAGIGPGDDQEIAGTARFDGRADLFHHLRRGNDLLILHMAASLRRDLIFDMDRRNSGEFVLLNRANYVERIPVAGVRIGDHGHVYGLGDTVRVIHHLRHRQQTHIGPAEQGGRSSKSRHVDSREAGLLDHTRRQCIVGAGRYDHLSGAHHVAKQRPIASVTPQKIVHPSPMPP